MLPRKQTVLRKKIEIPFYSGKDGYYPEKQKFFLENDVF